MTGLPSCRYSPTGRWLPGRHLEGVDQDNRPLCPSPLTCDGCEPCPVDHCLVCGTVHTDTAHPLTCPTCLASVREALQEVAALTGGLGRQALMLAAAYMPGGDALALMIPGNTHTPGGGRHDLEYSSPTDPQSPLLVLASWEDDWRHIIGHEPAGRASIASCTAYLGAQLTWASQHQATGFPDFAHEISVARRRLEDVLYDGDRPIVGVKCFDCDGDLTQVFTPPKRCKHPNPVRAQLVAAVTYPGWEAWYRLTPVELRAARSCGACDQGGRRDAWVCSYCRRRFSDGQYRAAVAHAKENLDPLKTAGEVFALTGVKPATLRQWLVREHLDDHGKDGRGRRLYDVDQVRRHAGVSGLLAS